VRTFLRRRTLPWTLAVWLAAASPFPAVADSEPFTVDAMLRSEGFGSVRLTPDSRQVLFERLGPYDSADRFDLSYLGQWGTSEIWIAPSDGSSPARPLMSPDERRGVMLGDWSPSGRRLLVHRLQGDRWESGVVEMRTGSVHWLGAGAEPPVKGETAVWRSEDELLLIVRTDGGLPYEIGGLASAERLTEERRRIAREGGVATTVWGAGALADRGGYSAATRVLRIDLRTGRQSVLLDGQAVDMALSKSGRWLAVVNRGQPNAIDPTAPFRAGEQPDARNLTLVDMDNGASWEPCGDCDVAASLLDWSDDDRLLVWTRDSSRVATQGRLLAIAPGPHSITALALHGLEPDVGAFRDAAFQAVRASWLGRSPILLSRHPGEARADWRRLDADGAENLTRDLPVSPGGLQAIWNTGFLLVADGAAWSVDAKGAAARRPVSVPVSPVTTLTHWASPRLRLNSPPNRKWTLGRGADGSLWRIPEHGGAVSLRPAGPRAALEALNREVVVEDATLNGVQTLQIRGVDGSPRPIAIANPAFAALTFAEALPVRSARLPDGLSWLFAPPGGLKPKTPVVIVAYPGAPAEVPDNPAEFNAMANVQLLAGMGYAVLVPTLRSNGPEGPAAGLAERVVAWLDAALDQYPLLDGDKVGYLGHSFGGYAGLIVAARTERIKSFVIISAPADPASSWGAFAAFGRANPEFGITSRKNAGWGEQGQGAMGGPPWERSGAYIENSALYQADKIKAPVLLLHGELDFVPVTQAETMFTALWRQNKDVQLVTYWGEHHLLYSPGNIRDAWTRIDAWFAQTLGLSPARVIAPPAAPSGEPTPP